MDLEIGCCLSEGSPTMDKGPVGGTPACDSHQFREAARRPPHTYWWTKSTSPSVTRALGVGNTHRTDIKTTDGCETNILKLSLYMSVVTEARRF